MGTTRAHSARKSIPIDKLLEWAYREELPKQQGQTWAGMFASEAWTLGIRVDQSPTMERLPAYVGDPHPDALLLDHRVKSLPPVAIQWPAGRDILMGHLGAYISDTDPLVAFMQERPAALVMLHARMGTRPQWDLGPTQLKRVIGKNGKPTVEGITAGRRYAEGASCPLQLDIPPQEIACARFEYLVWASALTELASESWNLVDHHPLPPSAPLMPWLTQQRATSSPIVRFAPRYDRDGRSRKISC